MEKWYADNKTEGSVIISSRMRLARNIKKYPFQLTIGKEDAEKMIKETVGAIKNDRTLLADHFQSVNIQEKSEIEKKAILEKHIVSPELLRIKKPVGLLVQDDEAVSIMINEEDHIRIQTIAPGDDIDNAWDMANRIDDLIEESVEYAFDKDYGYLTSCPTNTGTGLRASFMVHLPLLERTGYLKNMLPAVSKFGMTLRGIYGEGSEPLGSIYQISNQVTMGKTEDDIIGSLKNVTNLLIEKENLIGRKIIKETRAEIEDRVYRSYGILTYSRKLSAKEAMSLLSDIRFGYITGILDMPKPKLTIYNIMMNIQPGNLQLSTQKELADTEEDSEAIVKRDIARAEYIREMFAK